MSISQPARSGSWGTKRSSVAVGASRSSRPLREAAVQGADDVLVLAYRVAVGAVAQPAAQPPFRLTLDLGLEAERGQQVADRLLGRRGGRRGELLSDPAAGGLDLAQAGGRGGNAAREPDRERAVGVRRVAAGAGGGRDRPFVAGPPAWSGGAAVGHQAGVAHALQVACARRWDAGPAARPARRWRRRRRAAEEREQPSTRRLGEHVVVPVGLGEVNTSQFSHLAVGNRRCMLRCPTLVGRDRGAMTLPTTRTGL